MKKTKTVELFDAKVIIYGLDGGVKFMKYIAKWLEKLSKDLVKSAKKQSKTKIAEYSKIFTAKLLK